MNFLDRFFKKSSNMTLLKKFVLWEPICPMLKEGQTWRSQVLLFAILRTRLERCYSLLAAPFIMPDFLLVGVTCDLKARPSATRGVNSRGLGRFAFCRSDGNTVKENGYRLMSLALFQLVHDCFHIFNPCSLSMNFNKLVAHLWTAFTSEK